MLTKRIIPCLDVRDGRVTKGIEFKDNIDVGDPVSMGRHYYEEGADEIVFYDITASSDRRDIMIEVVNNVAREIFIPFSVGGGIRSLSDMRKVLLAGAEKVSVNSGAVRDPQIITEGAKAFGSQCIVLSLDAKQVPKTPKIPSGYEIVIDGGRTPTGIDTIEWVKQGCSLGAGEICANSIDKDGKTSGFEINLTRMIAEAVDVPVIASGGAGEPKHLYDVFTDGKADAAIVASIIHYGNYTIPQIKEYLKDRGIIVRDVMPINANKSAFG